METSTEKAWVERSNKRAISKVEKSDIYNTSGKALIFPGGIGSDDNPGEIEELISAGFKPEQIVGFEKDPNVYRDLNNHYAAQNISLFKFPIENIINKFPLSSCTYMHLDFMSSIKRSIYPSAKYFSTVMADDSRFRITIGATPARGRGNYQTYCTKNLAYQVFLPMCYSNGINTFKKNRVEKRINSHFELEKFNDPTSGRTGFQGEYGDISIAMFLFMAFGAQAAKDILYLKSFDGAAEYLRRYKRFANIKITTTPTKIKYQDTSYSKMLTTWFDISHQRITMYEFLNDLCDYIIAPIEEFKG